MKLSVYVGLRAIGWLVADGCNVVQAGVRRVNVSFDDYYAYIAGLPAPKRIVRREKRSQRRRLRRYKMRLWVLRSFCKRTFGVEPRYLSKREGLELRVRGLSEQLSQQELVDVLWSLVRKRGYLSTRKDGAGGNDNSEYLAQIETNEAQLQNYRSIADYLLTLPSDKNLIFRRDSYIKEFWDIMAHQNVDDNTKSKLYKILFYQRPIKLRRSWCGYEPGKKSMHNSHPLFQLLRCHRDANNIELWNWRTGEHLEIPLEMRLLWAETLYSGSNLTRRKCLKDLGIKNYDDYEWRSGQSLKGYELAKICKALDLNVDLEQIWNDLFSSIKEDSLRQYLSRKYGLDEVKLDKLVKYNIQSAGWSQFSARAIKKLLPLLKNGFKLKDAVLRVYGEIEKSEKIKNVVLEQHYYATKSLVEAIKRRYKIDEIVFELDWFLKASAEERRNAAKKRRYIESIKKEHPDWSDYQIQKVSIWEDCRKRSPYEPNRELTLEEVLSTEYNIDHVVPKSRLFERGEANLVICRRDLNEEKGKMTGYEFAEKLGILDEYVEFARSLSRRRQDFLLMKSDGLPLNAVSRMQCADYHTKCFNELFKKYADKVVNIPNKLLSFYQKEWHDSPYNTNNAYYYLQLAWVAGNMDEGTIEYFDSLPINTNTSPYVITPVLDKIEYDVYPITFSHLKHVKKIGNHFVARGELHGETVYGKRVESSVMSNGKLVENVYYTVRKHVSSLTLPMVKRIIDEKIRAKILQEIERAKGFDVWKKSNPTHITLDDGRLVRTVKIKVNYSTLTHIPQRGYVQPSKYAMVVFDYVDGKIKGTPITLMDYVKALNNGEMIDRGFHVKHNDIVKIDGKLYYIVGLGLSITARPVWDMTSSSYDFTLTRIGSAIKVKQSVLDYERDEHYADFAKSQDGIFGYTQRNAQGVLL